MSRVVLAALAAVLVAGCGEKVAERNAAPAAARACPAKWKPGWQRLANRIDAPVYCPGWMPAPIDADIDGQWNNIDSVSRDRSYLQGFAWMEAGQEVHVNFRGFPGRTAIPDCDGVPCFSDARGTRTIRGLRVTTYTVNRGADQWHVLYAWRAHGGLYTVSEHVHAPLSYRQVVRNLDRLMRSLVVVRPA